MNTSKRNPAFIAIGIILIVVGIIIFAVSCIQLYEVQHTESRWIEGFMQDYQKRTNAENSIPCYIFMALSAVMVIGGIIMLAIRPRSPITVQNSYVIPQQIPPTPPQSIIVQRNFCSNCGNKIESHSKFCTKCGKRVQ